MNKDIKLIATDIDGTLVKESSPNITKEQVLLFRALCDKGINVCVSSGRQFGSVRKVFAPVERQLFYIVENGAHILKGHETLSCTPMKRELVESLMTDLRRYYPDDCHVVASTTSGCFLESKNEDFITLIRDGYRNDVYMKIFLDGNLFMDASVDKGNGLKFLMEYLLLDPSSVMAFGDNENDIGMMQAAGTSYAVGNAVDKVKEAATAVCFPYWEQGVDRILQTLL